MPKYDLRNMTVRELVSILDRLGVKVFSYEEGKRPNAAMMGPNSKVVYRGSYIQRSKFAQPKEIFVDFVVFGGLPQEVDQMELRQMCKTYIDLFEKA